MASRDTITLEGTATVQEILSEIGVYSIPPGCEMKMDDEVEINVTADKDELIVELNEELNERDAEAIRAGFEEIRKGDFASALALFSRTFTEREMAAAETGLRGQHSAGACLPGLPLSAPPTAIAA